jgi:hypothetical protein
MIRMSTQFGKLERNLHKIYEVEESLPYKEDTSTTCCLKLSLNCQL